MMLVDSRRGGGVLGARFSDDSSLIAGWGGGSLET